MDAQGSQDHAQEDTRFLALDGALTDDLSQYGQDLTAATGGGYELASARTALDRFEIYLSIDDVNEASKFLVARHNPAITAASWGILTDASSRLAVASGSPPTVLWTSAAAIDPGYLEVTWSCRTNPDTTGASDACISEVLFVLEGDIIEIAQFVHAEPPTDPTWTLSVGGLWNGAVLTSRPTNAPTHVRVSGAPHSHAESYEEWTAAIGISRPAHATTLIDPVEPIGGAEVGEQGDWAGAPNIGWAAAMHDAARGRMLSPISLVYRDARTLTATPSPTQWHAQAPGSSYLLDASRLLWLPADSCRWAEVRVQVQSWVTAGAAVPVGVRVYACNRPHLGLGVQLDGKPIPPLQTEWVGAVLTADHGASGVGEWLDLGLLRMPALAEPVEGWANTVTIGVAYKFDPEGVSGNDANARLKIKAVQLMPLLGDP